MKNWKPFLKKNIPLIGVIFIIITLILVFFIPTAHISSLSTNESYLLYQEKRITYYRLPVSKGHTYDVYISIHHLEDDPTIVLYSNRLMMLGLQRNFDRYMHYTIDFMAIHDNYYYLMIKDYDKSYFDLVYYDIGSVYTSSAKNYINAWRIFLIFGLIMLIPSYAIISIRYTQDFSRLKTEIQLKVCPICKAPLKKEAEFCEFCGKIFIQPKDTSIS